jgi:hypothetical protein
MFGRLLGAAANTPPYIIKNETSLWPLAVSFLAGVAIPVVIETLRLRTQSAERRTDLDEARRDRQDEREQARRDHEEERATERESEHRDYQRATMIELQEVLSDFMREIGRAHSVDVQAYKAAGGDGEFPKSLLGDDLSEKIATLQRRIIVLCSRVEDDEARQLTEDTVGHVLSALLPDDRTRAASEAALRRGGETFKAVIALLGRLPRSLPA